MKFSKEERSHSNVFYRQLYAVWNHMYQRCYNKKNKSYHTYGAKGVKTDKKWLTFDGFAEDVDHIDGWNKELFLKHKLVLDKDYKVPGNNIYSRNTCTWMDGIKNTQWRPHYMKEVVIQDPKGNRYAERNLSKVRREYPLNGDNIEKMLQGKMKVAKNDWQIRYKGDEDTFVPFDEIHEHLMVYTPDNRLVECISKKDVAERFGLNIESIWKFMGKHNHNNSIRGYQIWYKSQFSPNKILPKSKLYTKHSGKLWGVKVYSKKTNELMFNGTIEEACEFFGCKRKAVTNAISATRTGVNESKTRKYIAIYK